jgi:hypothetical protein
VLRQPGKLWVRAGTGEDLSIFLRYGASALAFEGPRDYRGTAPRVARGDGRVHELNEVVWETHGDLLAHPNMVASWYHAGWSC